MTKTALIIARHGNTFNTGDIITRVGKTDLPLVESGLNQGYKLGEYLLQHHLQPDIIYTSALKRTQQTAQQAQRAMGTSLAIHTLTIFNEIDYGIDENQPEEAVKARLGETALKAWDESATVPDGWKVNPSEIIQHWLEFAKKQCTDYHGKKILVVTSNGIARFSPYITGDFNTFRQQHSIKIATGAVCLFEYDDVENFHWQCTAWNIKP